MSLEVESALVMRSHIPFENRLLLFVFLFCAAISVGCSSSSTSTTPTEVGASRASAYIINATPFTVTVMVNGGAAAAVPPYTLNGSTITGSLVSVPYQAAPAPGVIGGGNIANTISVSSPQYIQPVVHSVTIDSSQIPLISDVYIWLFTSSVVCASSSGLSNGCQAQ